MAAWFVLDATKHFLNTMRNFEFMARDTFLIEDTNLSELIERIILAQMARCNMRGESAWACYADALHFEHWLKASLFSLILPQIKHDFRIEIQLVCWNRPEALARIKIYGARMACLSQIKLTFPHQILGLDKLNSSLPKTNYQGVYFNTGADLHSNLFDFGKCLAKVLAKALLGCVPSVGQGADYRHTSVLPIDKMEVIS